MSNIGMSGMRHKLALLLQANFCLKSKGKVLLITRLPHGSAVCDFFITNRGMAVIASVCMWDAFAYISGGMPLYCVESRLACLREGLVREKGAACPLPCPCLFRPAPGLP